MANNQFLTVGDVYNPVDTEMKIQSINQAKMKNRVDAMKMRELYQQQQRRNKLLSDPRGAYNPVSDQFSPRPQDGQPMGQQAPMQNVQAQGQPSAPVQQQQQQVPQLSDEDRAAIRGQKKLVSIAKQVQPLIQQAKNDPSARVRINKLAQGLENDTDHQALITKSGYDAMKYTMDEETGKGSYSLTKTWTAEELQKRADNAPNGQLFAPLIKHPGKYTLEFDDNGVATGYSMGSKEDQKKQESLTESQWIDKSLHDPDPAERQRAKEVLDEEARRKESASMFGETDMSDATVNALAYRFNMTGEIPAMGRGKIATKNRMKVFDTWSKNMEKEGRTAGDQILAQADYKSMKSALSDVTRRKELIGTYVRRIDATSDLVLDFAKKVKNTDSRLLNMPRNKVISAMGSGNYRAFELALFSLSAEIGKVETGQLGISAVTDAQLKVMNAIHDPNLSIAELQKLIEGGKALGRTSMESINGQLKDLREDIRSGSNTLPSKKQTQPAKRMTFKPDTGEFK